VSSPPFSVLVVVVLDIVAALSSLIAIDATGLIGAGIQFVFFALLAMGLWNLRRWAWITEITITLLQLLFLIVGGWFVVYGPASVELSEGFPKHELLYFIAALIILNILVLALLGRAAVRVRFNQRIQ
jgi:hypothetical protein